MAGGGGSSSSSSGSSIMESLFQRSVEDLIKGIRIQMMGESKFISKSMEELRREIKSTDPQTKSTALDKLTYLNSIYGIDMSWAAFHVVEVMSSARFIHKKIGYLAASQSFHQGTDVILLITNQLRKDLTSTNEFEVGLALECLSVFATTDLARDLTPEIFTLLSSTRVLVKKKALAVVLRVFSMFPDAVRVSFKRLVENLETNSSDPHALSAAIGVFCELTSRDPKSYLPLAPEFYRILVDSKNNWVLIKVIKIFSKLAPLEPRLAKRVVEPICDHMRKTTAKSLMFECIRTVVTCLSDYESAVKLAVEKIRELLVDEDPNLKYLGLQALSIVGSKHLWAVLENKEVVIQSLSDTDPNIKLESLSLVMEMVSESNVTEITHVLVHYSLKSDHPEFCNEILGSILSTCSRNVYEVIVDFDWYVSLLGEMSRNPHCQKGEEIERQLVDICMRVREVRPEVVRVVRDLLIDPSLLGNPYLHWILSASAWVSGEYVEFSRNPFELMEALLQPRTNLLPPLMRAVYIQSAFKVLVFCLHSYLEQSEVLSSSTGDLAPTMGGLNIDTKSPEVSDVSKHEASTVCEQDEGFNPRVSCTSEEDLNMEDGGDRIVANEQASSSFSYDKDPFSHGSIVHLLNLIKMALGPLSGSDEVEVQERARNVLGLIELIQQEIPGSLVKDGSLKGKELQASKIIEMMHDAFSKELGPVSMSAQEKVVIPDGLVLNENLAELETVCGDILLPQSNPFSLGNRLFGKQDNSLQKKEESEQSTESTSLLSQHRKRHGLYYLSTDKNEIGSHDYPPANDPESLPNINDGAHHLLKLTENSVLSRKKSSNLKPRPMVVRLDEGDEAPVLTLEKGKDSKDDSLSGAVRDILLGDEAKPTASQINPSGKSSGRRRLKDVLLHSALDSESKAYLADEEKTPNYESQNLRRNNHGKEKQRRSKKYDNETEESNQKGKQTIHRHGRRKTRQRPDVPLDVGAQTPVIPDFLLDLSFNAFTGNLHETFSFLSSVSSMFLQSKPVYRFPLMSLQFFLLKIWPAPPPPPYTPPPGGRSDIEAGGIARIVISHLVVGAVVAFFLTQRKS